MPMLIGSCGKKVSRVGLPAGKFLKGFGRIFFAQPEINYGTFQLSQKQVKTKWFHKP